MSARTSRVLPHPVKFLGVCIAALPVIWAVSTIATTYWYEHAYLPRIAGEE